MACKRSTSSLEAVVGVCKQSLQIKGPPGVLIYFPGMSVFEAPHHTSTPLQTVAGTTPLPWKSPGCQGFGPVERHLPGQDGPLEYGLSNPPVP